MKYLILIIPILTGCTKTYDCETTNNTSGSNPSTQVYYHEFEGTKDEMEQFEISGNLVIEFTNYTLITTTVCK